VAATRSTARDVRRGGGGGGISRPFKGDSAALRAAVYTRVSTGRQAEDGFSPGEQERRAVEHIGRAGWSHAGTFREEGVSGAKRSRPALDRLLGELDAVDAVVVSSLDRLGRSTKDLLELYDRFEHAGVALVSLREQIDTSTPVGRLLRTVLSAVAEFERDLGVECTSSGIGARARTEGKPWGTPAYGYAKGDHGHWGVEPGERAVVERIFRESVDRGQSYSAIAKALNRDGVPPRRGSQWTATVVRRILRECAVRGFFRHGADWHRGGHEAIIDEDTWLAAQVVAERGRKYAPSGRTGRIPRRHVFVRGALRCGLCGAAMLPRAAPHQQDMYICATRKATGGADACAMPPLPRTRVDFAALQRFQAWIVDVEATRRRLADATSVRLAETRPHAERAASAEAKAAERLARIRRDYVDGKLTAEEWHDLRSELEAEHGAAEAEHVRLAAQVERVREAGAKLTTDEDVVARLHALEVALTTKVRAAVQASEAEADLGPVRAALAQVFETVTVRRRNAPPTSTTRRSIRLATCCPAPSCS